MSRKENGSCVRTISSATEADMLGLAEPGEDGEAADDADDDAGDDAGSPVCLEGCVFHEDASGFLVVNVTWRGKSFVGTLLDSSRHDWAPPRYALTSHMR